MIDCIKSHGNSRPTESEGYLSELCDKCEAGAYSTGPLLESAKTLFGAPTGTPTAAPSADGASTDAGASLSSGCYSWIARVAIGIGFV